MQLSTYSDYSFRVLMYAALRSPERVTVGDVAEIFGISCHHVCKVVHHLGRSGYLQTRRGCRGGFTLALPPEEIGLGDIVRLGEDTEAVMECVGKSNYPCHMFPVCRLKHFLDEAAATFFATLDSYTLADLVKQPSEIRTALQV